MRRAGLRPDAQTHNLVLEAVAKAARSGKAGMPDAFAALRELKGSGATPDGATFRALMDTAAWSARHGRATLEDAAAVLAEMRAAGREPGASAYSGVMAVAAGMASLGRCPPPPSPSRTNWTRLVPSPVLTGHVSG
jgi:hypothetical protein